MGTRIVAERVLTGEILHRDVPLRKYTGARTLSGPSDVSGTINPELQDQIAADGRPLLEEWSTALYEEVDGHIVAGGIIQTIEEKGPELAVTAPGFLSYPTEQPYLADYMPNQFEDPTVVWANIWKWLQDQPDGNLGLEVVGDHTYMILGDDAGPYSMLGYEYRDCGQELETIAAAAPFDYDEQHTWDATHSRILHRARIGFPRLGRQRSDLRFAFGENLLDYATVAYDGARFANDVRVLGNGEGLGMIVGRASVRDGRIRRAITVPYKTFKQGLADTYAKRELQARAMLQDVSEITVKSVHANAVARSIQPGDDLLVEFNLQHSGRVKMWLRALSIQTSSETPDRTVIKTMRSDYFTYAAAENPNTNGEPYLVTT